MVRRYPRETPESKLFDTLLGGLGRLFGTAVTSYQRRLSRGVVASSVDRSRGPLDRAYVREEWLKIQETMRSGGESRFQQAVIGADKLLDYVLRSKVPGETLGERLKNGRQVFSSNETYQAAWNGHKLRNRLVHEMNYATVSWEAKEAMADFERALRDLRAL